jgi:phosphoribosylformimino-5-aminoimidazole carboxamide ribotide isomerase
LKVIPVIDVLNGVAVHAVRGERSRYQPLRSVLCDSVDPAAVALTFESLGFKSLYMADLDAILGKSTNFAVYKQIRTKTSLNLMVDAGVSTVADAEKLLNSGVTKIVVGTESLPALDTVNQLIKTFGENRVLVSIDLKGGKVMSVSETVGSLSAVQLAQALQKRGVAQIILLDLDRVGTERGANLRVLEAVLRKTKLEVLVGGGIKGFEELTKLKTLGASGVLVATALHNGKLKIDRLKLAGFM